MRLTRRQILGGALMIAFTPRAVLAQTQEDTPEAATLTLPPMAEGEGPVPYNFENLVDKDGALLSAQDVDAKYVLVYGGYLECTGVCPGAAHSLVGAIKALREQDPALAAQIVPIVVMIKNNDGDTLEDAQARAARWQAEGLEGEETGIRVLVSGDQGVLDNFMEVFGNRIDEQHDGALVHSPWAYLFDTDRNFDSLVQTQEGVEAVLQALRTRIQRPGANVEAVPSPP